MADAGRRSAGEAASVARWLGLAATPCFAAMAILAAHEGRSDGALCSAAHRAVLGGMVPMYLMMAVFHATPWVQRIARRCRLNAA